jgi:C4-dicarboxylate-specific signal transduction histidine kinase
MPSAGWVASMSGTRRDGEFFLVEIADNGSGIPPEAPPHIFAVPFFTTKGHFGTGLGLVISHRIVVETASRKNRLQHGSGWHTI